MKVTPNPGARASQGAEGAWILRGPRVFRGGGVDRAHDRSLAIDGGRIAATASPARVVGLPQDWIAVPGFVDAHTHGAMGADVMDARAASLARIAAYLPTEGTTSFLGATMTNPSAAIEAALEQLGAFRGEPTAAELLGVHLEGPFINAEKAGAQPVEFVQKPCVTTFERWQKLSRGRIRVVTLAPELDGADALIAYLVEHGVRASIGHSACSAAQAQGAIAAGAARGTHLFNMMAGLDHKRPGAPCTLLTNPGARNELIVDGIHVMPEMVELAYQLLGSRRLMAVSDSMRGKGLADGEFLLGGQRVQVSQGAARLVGGPPGVLAGSVLAMNRAFQNLIRFTHCSVAEAVWMTSTNAAEDLGVGSRKGRLLEGFDADVVVMDAECNVRLTICRGRPAYDPERRAEPVNGA